MTDLVAAVMYLAESSHVCVAIEPKQTTGGCDAPTGAATTKRRVRNVSVTHLRSWEIKTELEKLDSLPS